MDSITDLTEAVEAIPLPDTPRSQNDAVYKVALIKKNGDPILLGTASATNSILSYEIPVASVNAVNTEVLELVSKDIATNFTDVSEVEKIDEYDVLSRLIKVMRKDFGTIFVFVQLSNVGIRIMPYLYTQRDIDDAAGEIDVNSDIIDVVHKSFTDDECAFLSDDLLIEKLKQKANVRINFSVA